MHLSTIACFSAETALGFTVKNSFYYYGLSKVRTDLQKTVTEIALPKFGSFVAPLLGNQIGLMLAMPVTLFYGELFAFAAKKLVRAVYSLVMSLFYDIKNQRPTIPLFREVLFTITAFVAGFFAKTYFCNYAMEPLAGVLSNLAVVAAPVLGISLPVLLLMPAIIPVITPAATLLLGDLAGFAINKFTYELLTDVSSALCDRNIKQK